MTCKAINYNVVKKLTLYTYYLMNFGNFLHVYICMEIFFQRRSTQSKSGHDHGALLKLKIKLHV